MAEKINCIIVDDEPVARDVLENHLAKIEHIRLVRSCKSAVEAFRAINEHPVDLVFLDINMPEITGLSFAKSISASPKIIFTTAYRDYAVDGFDLKAVDYLLKPISFERLLQALNKYIDETAVVASVRNGEFPVEQEDFIFIRSDRKMVKVDFGDIRFIESLGDYLKIHLDENRTLVTRDSISNISARLPGDDFMRVHRSFIVSIRKIDSFTSETIGIGRHEIPISRSHRNEVLERLGGI